MTTLAFKKPVISDLAAEAMALDVWHGRTIYADFLREHNRRPDPAQAAAIGKIMGTRVRASDGSMQPKPASRRR